MKNKQLLHEVLALLRTVEEDEITLEKIHNFLLKEIVDITEIIEIPKRYKEAITTIADNA